MLRCLDEHGGISIYARNILEELLRLDRENGYVLYYRNPDHLGRYSHFENVEERVVGPSPKPLWDQVAIPLACWKDRVDLVFHPKFTVPLLAPCKAVMTVHGADWFIPEHAQYYGWLDVQYIKAVMPRYFQKADAVVSVSELTTQNFNEILGLTEDKIKTIYFGPARHFRRITDKTVLAEVKSRYGLPEQFIFALTKAGGGDRKNFGQMLQAYAIHHGRSPHKFVVGGKDLERFRTDYNIPDKGYGADVIFPGWIRQEDLPAVYSLADIFLYPSNVEAFPIPITEAMACGTPIVTSNANGLKEIAGEAAVFVDPQDPQEIANAIQRVLSDAELRRSLRVKGLTRSTRYSWERCAQETLALLQNVAS